MADDSPYLQPRPQETQHHAELILEAQAHVRSLAETQARAEGEGKQLADRLSKFVTLWKELTQTKAGLLEMTRTLDARVAARTAELTQMVEALTREVTERKRAEESLRGQAQQLRALTAQLTLAEQHERERLAEVLHDDLQQLLVGARLVLRTLEKAVDPAVREASREAAAMLEQALTCSRTLTYELSPPILKQGALVPALEWLAHWMAQHQGVSVEVKSEGSIGPASEALCITLFRAVRELLLNVVKHAKVSQALLAISRRGEVIEILVEDAGSGFDPAQVEQCAHDGQGFGLSSIRERLGLLGGRIEIESLPGRGTRIKLQAPLDTADAREESPSGPSM